MDPPPSPLGSTAAISTAQDQKLYARVQLRATKTYDLLSQEFPPNSVRFSRNPSHAGPREIRARARCVSSEIRALVKRCSFILYFHLLTPSKIETHAMCTFSQSAQFAAHFLLLLDVPTCQNSRFCTQKLFSHRFQRPTVAPAT